MKKLGQNAKKRKRICIAAAVLTAAFLLLFGGYARPSAAKSEEAEAGQAALEGTVEALLGALDTEELQRYLDSLSDFSGISIKEKLRSLITGDLKLDYGDVLGSALNFVWEEGQAMLPAFAVILAVTLLCGILNSAKNGFLQSTTSDIIHFVSYISVGAVVLATLIGVLESGFSAVFSMQRQAEIVFPLLMTLMAASGGTVSVGIFRPAVAFLSGAILQLFTDIVLPIAVAVIVLAFVGNLSKDVRTEKLGEFFKSIAKWLLGMVLGIFGFFLTVQGISAAQYDGLSLRAAKYVIAGSVPIVGGFLSGGVELVVAGSLVIKNAVGCFALFLLAGTVLRPLLLFLAFRLFLRLAAAVTEPVDGKISAFLSRLAADSGYFLAALLCIAFLYFLTILLLICSTGAFL